MPFIFDPENPTQQPPYRSNTDGILYEILKATKECATGGGGGGGGVTISSRGFANDANGLPVIDRLATNTGNVDIIQDAANSRYQRSGVGAVTRLVNKKLEENVSVEDFGALGDGVADDTAAIQAGVSYLKTLGGGTLNFKSGSTYAISNAILISSYIRLNGNRCIIKQIENTKSIFSFTNEALYVQNSSADNFILRYATQTETANFVGAIVLSAENKVSWYLHISRIIIENADTCIILPRATGCNCFLTTLIDIGCSMPFGYGIYIYGDEASSGTNITVNNCWVTGFAEYENNTQGMYFRGVLGLQLNHVVFERMRNSVLVLETCVGAASCIYIETLLLGTFGSSRNIIDFINTNFDVQSISTSSSFVSPNNGDIFLLNIQNDYTSRNVRVSQIVEVDPTINEGGGFRYYVARNVSISEKGSGVIGYYTSGNTDYNPRTIAVPISGMFKERLSAAEHITLQQSTPAKGIIATGTPGNTFSLGTTPGGTDIVNAGVLDANGKYISNNLLYYTTDKNFYISGNASPVTIILPI